jgi:hypothetical protein
MGNDTGKKNNVKLDLAHVLYRGDLSRWTKEFKPQSGFRILVWKMRAEAENGDYQLVDGVPDTPVTLMDVLTATYESKSETREDKSKKNRLLKEMHKAARKNKGQFVISPTDAEFTLDAAAKAVDTVAYGQLEDLVEGRIPLGYEEEGDEQGDGQGTGGGGGAGESGGGPGSPEDNEDDTRS